MTDKKFSDLEEFMQQQQNYFASEFDRIQQRVREDPSLAGAQAEENWAQLLRDWLPHTYHVVTRGRIISPVGVTTPEVDVLVLHPSYPKYLLNKKYYLSGGVVAGFECKLTLRRTQLGKIISTCARVKEVGGGALAYSDDFDHCFPLFGVLSHSQQISKQEHPIDVALEIGWALKDEIAKQLHSPVTVPDMVCIADFATIYREYSANALRFGEACALHDGVDGADDVHRKRVSYSWATPTPARPGSSLAWLVKRLMMELTTVDPSLERLHRHYDDAISTSSHCGQYIILRRKPLEPPESSLSDL
ncbi:MAG: DUF6602 domain-containing protein [Burkholderiales bacterium]|nr:DUF6602 domain-containing protein [Burkholderiales bacterium]